MVSVMVNVAQGEIQLEDVQWLLDNPDNLNWDKYKLDLAPAGGLYLQDISHDPIGNYYIEKKFITILFFCF